MSRRRSSPFIPRPVRQSLAIALVAVLVLILGACGFLSPLAPVTVPSSGLGLSFQQGEATAQPGEKTATLTVTVQDKPATYRTAAMPYSWDTAVVTLTGGTLPATQSRTVTQSKFNGSNYATAVITGIVPGSGFALSVKLYTGGASGVLIAQGTNAAFSLVAGAQTITVTEGLAPYITSIGPNPSAAGNTVTIEGQGFGTSATVNFPGGSAAATMIGLDRLSAVIPAGARQGSLTVTTGGVTTNGLPFTASPYANGLDGFVNTNYQTDSAEATVSLATARYAHTSLAIGQTIYVLGGNTGTSPLSSVEAARLNSNGTLGAFAAVPGVSLVTARYGHASVVVGNYAYVLGGFGAGAVPLASVERAAITNGSLGSFSTVAGVTLATARGYLSTAIVGGYLYAFGGLGSTTLGTVERAVINSDGTIGSFSIVPGVTLVQARQQHATMVVGSYLYAIGGSDGTTALASVERAPVNPDGSLGGFSAVAGVSLATARRGLACFVSGTTLCVVGGADATSTPLNSVEQAPINANGTLGAFAIAAGNTLQTARYAASAVACAGNVFLVGGSGSVALASVETASINSSGGLANFVASANTLANITYLPGSVATPGHFYVIGGLDKLASTALAYVQEATVAADGTLGAFTIKESLLTARYAPLVVRAGGYVYVMGGRDGADNPIVSIERAAIQPDGSLGPFAAVAYTLLSAHWCGSAVVVGSYLYAMAGESLAGSNPSALPGTDIEVAPLDSAGNLTGAFTSVASVLSTGIEAYAGLLIGNTYYLLGGIDATYVPTTLVQTITFDSTGAVVLTGTGGALATGRQLMSAAVVGSTAYLVGGYNGGGQLSVEQCPIAANGTLGTWVTGSATLSSARWGAAIAVLGNSVYALGGKAVAGANPSLNSIDVGALN